MIHNTATTLPAHKTLDVIRVKNNTLKYFTRTKRNKNQFVNKVWRITQTITLMSVTALPHEFISHGNSVGHTLSPIDGV
jgi:hypothetical protein